MSVADSARVVPVVTEPLPTPFCGMMNWKMSCSVVFGAVEPVLPKLAEIGPAKMLPETRKFALPGMNVVAMAGAEVNAAAAASVKISRRISRKLPWLIGVTTLLTIGQSPERGTVPGIFLQKSLSLNVIH